MQHVVLPLPTRRRDPDDLAMTPPATDYRSLMRRVEELVAGLPHRQEVEETVLLVAEGVVAKFESELGLVGGRIYRERGEDYVLRTTFGRAKAVEAGLLVPRTYPPIAECLEAGTVVMDSSEPGTDASLEATLGTREFACVEAGDGDWVLAFDVAPGIAREDVLFSLGILRYAVNEEIRQERLGSILREARKIQSSILPRQAPKYHDFEMAGRAVPIDGVGGDLFDYIPLTDKILGLAIADVSGHGLAAALQTRDVYMGLRMGLGRDYKIVRTVERLNEIIHRSTLTSRFVALFYGELEPSGIFIYVNAGHIAPFVLAVDGSIRYLTEGGAVLGPLPRATYERGFVRLERGDLLVLFTDGMVEATDPEGHELGPDGLAAIVARLRDRPVAEIVDATFEAVRGYTVDSAPADDRTLVIVRRPA